MTDEGRRKHVQRALTARDEKPSSERHSHPLAWRGGEHYFPVVELPLDVPVLNADSHRIRAQLEASQYEFVRKERTTEQAQAVLADLWRSAHRKFDQLKESLSVEGQREPGVITRAGVLINGNTRLVALRELDDPNQRWIRVAVLDSDATPQELADLELRLQVQDPLRDDYKLSNVLLFVEEMVREHNMTSEQIAVALRWNPTRPAIGAKKVDLHRRIFQLVRHVQLRDPHVPITFFDDKLQHLKELELRYSELVAGGDPEGANVLLDTWLFVGRCGFESVHQIRSVTQSENFGLEFLLPRLEEQDLIGERAAELVQAKEVAPDLPGVAELQPGTDDGGIIESLDLRLLIDLIESSDDATVRLSDGQEEVPLEAERVKAALRTAVQGAIQDQLAVGKAEHALNTPVEALREATRALKKTIDTYRELRGTKEFERTARGAFEYQLRQLHRHTKVLEELVAGKEKTKSRP